MSVENINELTLAEIHAEIRRRQQLIGQMVGNLYPAVVCGEIVALEDRRDEIVQILKNEGVYHES